MEKRERLTFHISMQLLLLILFISGLSAGDGRFPVRQDRFGDFRPDQLTRTEAPSAPFSVPLNRIIRFYPPRASQDTPYIRLNPSVKDQSDPGEIRILLDRGDITLYLPALSPSVPVFLRIPADSYILGIELPDDGRAEDESFICLPRAPEGPFLEINTDDADTLVFTPPLSDTRGETYYSLKLENSREIRISRSGGDKLLLKPFSSGRNIVLYPGSHNSGALETEEESGPWSISPLNALESLSFEKLAVPDFPSPLPEVMSAVLWRSSDEWRDPDFELYRWAAFPSILIWDCRNYDIQNRFFRRLSYYVEKKGYRGALMSNGELMDKHGWNAHDYRPEDLADFFNRAAGTDFPLYKEETMLREILLESKTILLDPQGRYQPGSGAIISISRESSPVLRERFLVHEASHGLYFTSSEYRAFVLSLWESLEEEDRALWRFFLGWYGYDPADEDLMVNEFQAYLVQQKSDQASSYFDVRLKNLIKLYPSQRELLERGIGENSSLFTLWSGKISQWLEEKWGLKAGDFFPLYKELP